MIHLDTAIPVEYLWTFDWTFQDVTSIFNGIPINGLNFSSTSITGYGSALSLSSPQKQYLLIPDPQLKLYNQSWTFEAWIYLASLGEYGIVGQCRSQRNDECLHLLVRAERLHFGFWNADLFGNKTLMPSKWYHVAFTYDCDTLIQSVYLDGVIDIIRQAKVCFQGHNLSLTIGAVESNGPERFFDGLIDQLYFSNRSKNDHEILEDATLTVYYSFNDDSIVDQGPLGINGSVMGNVTFTNGSMGQALEITTVEASYILVQGLVLLGTSNRRYSFSIWIHPKVQQQAAIIQVSNLRNASDWYLPLLAVTSAGELVSHSWDGGVVSVVGRAIPADSWTHVAVTYNPANGLHLYVNGTHSNASRCRSGSIPLVRQRICFSAVLISLVSVGKHSTAVVRTWGRSTNFDCIRENWSPMTLIR